MSPTLFAAAGVGLFAAGRTFSNHPEEGMGDRASEAGIGGGIAAGLTVGAIGATAMGYRSGAFSLAGRGSVRLGSSYASSIRSDFAAASALQKAGKIGRGQAALRVIGRNPLALGGLGAIAGGAIAAHNDGDVVTGASIGAGVGIVAAGVSKFMGMRHVPVKGILGGLLVGTAAFAGGRALQSAEYDNEAETSPSGFGYEYADSGTSQRMRSMNVSGDIAFGLHNRRHG